MQQTQTYLQTINTFEPTCKQSTHKNGHAHTAHEHGHARSKHTNEHTHAADTNGHANNQHVETDMRTINTW